MKKNLSLLFCAFLFLLVIPTEKCAAESVSSRDDGIWFFPLNSGAYYQFTDWAGCPGWYPCPFHGYTHWDMGDDAHQYDGSTGHGHNGIDIGLGYGSTVYAAGYGTLYCHSSLDTPRGRYVVIEHPIGMDSSGQSWSYYSIYQHLSSIVTSLNTTFPTNKTI